MNESYINPDGQLCASFLLQNGTIIEANSTFSSQVNQAIIAIVEQLDIHSHNQPETQTSFFDELQAEFTVEATRIMDNRVKVSVYSTDTIAEGQSQESALSPSAPAPKLQNTPAGPWQHFMSEKLGDSAPWIALIYFIGLTLAEVATTIIDVRLGLLLHALLLTGLIVHAAFVWDSPLHRLLLTLTLAPLIRISSLAMPLNQYEIIYWFPITSIPIFVSAFFIVHMLKLPMGWFRINVRAWPLQILIALSGLGLGVLEYQILKPAPLINKLTWEQLLISSAILLISTGFLEEFVFRRVMQRAASEVLNRFGVYYVAMIFAALHIGYKSPIDLLFVFAVGLLFGWIVHITNNIIGVSIAHGLINIMLFLILPIALNNTLPAPHLDEEVTATVLTEPAPAPVTSNTLFSTTAQQSTVLPGVTFEPSIEQPDQTRIPTRISSGTDTPSPVLTPGPGRISIP